MRHEYTMNTLAANNKKVRVRFLASSYATDVARVFKSSDAGSIDRLGQAELHPLDVKCNEHKDENMC